MGWTRALLLQAHANSSTLIPARESISKAKVYVASRVDDACRVWRCAPVVSIPACASHHTLQQLKDDDIQPLCASLGRFKRLKVIDLVSRGM